MNDPTELHEAASVGNRRLLESLLVQGHYDIDSEDWTNGKKTPLHVAIERGKFLKIVMSQNIIFERAKDWNY